MFDFDLETYKARRESWVMYIGTVIILLSTNFYVVAMLYSFLAFTIICPEEAEDSNTEDDDDFEDPDESDFWDAMFRDQGLIMEEREGWSYVETILWN